MPNNAEPVTVKDGVVFIGKYEALDYDSGEPITVPKGSSREDVAKALKDAGAIVGKMRIFGLGNQAGDVVYSRKKETLDERKKSFTNFRGNASPVSNADIDALVARFNGRNGAVIGHGDGQAVVSRPTVVVARSWADMPAAVREHAAQAGYDNTNKADRILGAQWHGKMYLVQENISSVQEAEETLLHERVHQVLRGNANDKGGVELRKALNQLYLRVGGGSGIMQLASQAGMDLKDIRKQAAHEDGKSRNALVMEEFLATLDGNRAYEQFPDKVKRALQEFVGAFRNWLRNNGFEGLANRLGANLDAATLSDLRYMLKGLRTQEAGTGRDAVRFLRVWHGTPHRGIEKTGFKLNKIGTGEGAQVYGHGIYFAQAQDVAESYRRKLAEIRYQGKPLPKKQYVVGNGVSTKDFTIMTLGQLLQNGKPYAGFGGQLINGISFDEAKRQVQQEIEDAISGNIGGKQFLKDMKSALRELEKLQESDFQSGQLYSADIPESHELLDWDKPLSAQPKQVQKALKTTVKGFVEDTGESIKSVMSWTGAQLYNSLSASYTPKSASEHLRDAGIPGLRYLDGNSRTDGEGTHNFVIWDEARLTPEAAKIEPMYSRSANTKAAYEARIDALFDGAKANRDGIKVLDSSDMLSLLGYKGQPVTLAESKVLQGQDNHQRMTAEVWKKVPEWLEAPAAVFDSDTVDGRLVFIAPELVNGSPVRMIVEPNTQVGGLQVHLLVNAFDASGKTPWLRWAGDGLTRYMDKKKFPAILTPSGLQLSRVEQKAQGTGKILTEKNLAGWRKANAAQSADNAKRESTAITPANTPSTVAKVQSAIEGMFEGIADVRERIAKGTTVVQDASELPENLRQGAEDARAQALYDPYSDRVYMIASRIEAGQEKAVWLHEVFHKRGEDLLREALPRLHQAVQRWASRPTNSVERQIYEAAHARATNDGNYEAEFLAYAIEEAVNRGVQPELNGNITSAGYWLGRVREAFAAVVAKLTGIDVATKAVSAEDLMAAAYGAAGLEVAGKGSAGNLRGEILKALNQEKNNQAAYDAQTRFLEKMDSAEGVRVPDFLPDPTELGVKGINENNWVRDTANKLGEFLGVKPTHSGSRLGASSYLRYGNSEIRVSKHSKGAFNSQLYEHVTTQQDAVSLAKRVIEQRLALASELKSQRARKDEQTPQQRQFAETEKAIGGKPAYEQAKAAGKTKLTYRQWVQVRTPNFKAWFGDWEAATNNASKVIDPDTGEPMVVYHGGHRLDGNAFKTDNGFGGIFTNPDYEMAGEYAQQYSEKDGVIYPLFINAKNPVHEDDLTGRTQPELIASAKAAGHDAAWLDATTRRNGKAQYPSLVFFNPTQAKLATPDLYVDGTSFWWHEIVATGNSGAFDGTNPDIRYSRSELWTKRSPQAEPWSKATGQGGMRLDLSEKQTPVHCSR